MHLPHTHLFTHCLSTNPSTPIHPLACLSTPTSTYSLPIHSQFFLLPMHPPTVPPIHQLTHQFTHLPSICTLTHHLFIHPLLSPIYFTVCLSAWKVERERKQGKNKKWQGSGVEYNLQVLSPLSEPLVLIRWVIGELVSFLLCAAAVRSARQL